MKGIVLLGCVLWTSVLFSQKKEEDKIALWLARNHYYEALSYLDSLYRMGEKSPELFFYSGKANEGLMKYDKAYYWYRKWLEADADNMDARLAVARTANQAGRSAEALELYQQLAEEYPKHFLINYQLGSIYQQNGDHAKAVEILGQVLRMDEENISVLKRLAESYRALGWSQLVMDYYGKAFDLVPQDANLAVKIVNFALIHRQDIAGFLPRILNVLDTALVYNPRSVTLRQSFGVMKYFVDRFDECETVFRDLLAEGDEAKIDYKYLGLAYYQQEKYALALPVLKTADSLFRGDNRKERSDLDLSLKYAETLGRLKKTSESLQVLQEIKRQLEPDKRLLSQIAYTTGIVYGFSSQTDKAGDFYWKAYKLNPRNLQSVLNYVNLHKNDLLSDTKRAELSEKEKNKLLYAHLLILQRLKKSAFTGKDSLLALSREVVRKELDEMFFKNTDTLIVRDPDGKTHRFSDEELRQLIQL